MSEEQRRAFNKHIADNPTNYESFADFRNGFEAGWLAALSSPQGLLDPDMPAQELRLHMGELTAQEERTARAAIYWANSRMSSPQGGEVKKVGEVKQAEIRKEMGDL